MDRMVEEFVVRLPDSGEVVVVRRETQHAKRAIASARARVARVLKPQEMPFRWVGIIPQTTTENLISPMDCYGSHRESGAMWRIGSAMRCIPGGTIGIRQSLAVPLQDIGATVVAFDGLTFNGEYAEEVSGEKPLRLEDTERLVNETLVFARALYKRIKLPEDSLLLVSMGIDNVLNRRMHGLRGEGLEFPDDQFRFECVAEMATLSVEEIRKAVCDKLIWEFNIVGAPYFPESPGLRVQAGIQ
jgi:hypothetical protein